MPVEGALEVSDQSLAVRDVRKKTDSHQPRNAAIAASASGDLQGQTRQQQTASPELTEQSTLF
jgi:hypothetical protein